MMNVVCIAGISEWGVVAEELKNTSISLPPLPRFIMMSDDRGESQELVRWYDFMVNHLNNN